MRRRGGYKELFQLLFLIGSNCFDVTARSFVVLLFIHLCPCIAYNNGIRRQKVVPILQHNIKNTAQTLQKKLTNPKSAGNWNRQNSQQKRCGVDNTVFFLARSPEAPRTTIVTSFFNSMPLHNISLNHGSPLWGG